MDLATAKTALGAIEQSLDQARYRAGAWQTFVARSDALEGDDKRELSEAVSRVSRKLHGRHRFLQLPFALAFTLEMLLLALSLVLLVSDNLLLLVLGVGTLAFCLQPTLKVAAGLALGVRYDYAYLWFFEPRFKMRYGTYFTLAPSSRIALHLLGSLGTPLAMLMGSVALSATNELMALVCLVFFVGAAAMQIGAFIAEWCGVRMIGQFRLSNLTSPATAALEWQRLRARGSRSAEESRDG